MSQSLRLSGIGTLPFQKPKTLSVYFGRKPTLREQGRLATIEQMAKDRRTEPLFDAMSDPSQQVKLAAYKALYNTLPFHYLARDLWKHHCAVTMGTQAIQRYDNGQTIDKAMADLKKEGYRFLFGNDLIPRRLLTQDFLDAYDTDGELEEILDEGRTPTVREALRQEHAGEFIAPRTGQPGYVLFSMPKGKLSPATFWHEYFHYLQHKVGLPNTTPLPSYELSQREMEANQFVITHRKTLKLSRGDLATELRLWLHNANEALFHKLGEKRYLSHYFSITG